MTIHRIDLAKDGCDTLCLSGIAGKLANWAIGENDHGNPTFSLRRYRAFPTGTVGSPEAKSP